VRILLAIRVPHCYVSDHQSGEQVMTESQFNHLVSILRYVRNERFDDAELLVRDLSENERIDAYHLMDEMIKTIGKCLSDGEWNIIVGTESPLQAYDQWLRSHES
jgi:hypothetical protein